MRGIDFIVPIGAESQRQAACEVRRKECHRLRYP
jgi:hypothetical protein